MCALFIMDNGIFCPPAYQNLFDQAYQEVLFKNRNSKVAIRSNAILTSREIQRGIYIVINQMGVLKIKPTDDKLINKLVHIKNGIYGSYFFAKVINHGF